MSSAIPQHQTRSQVCPAYSQNVVPVYLSTLLIVSYQTATALPGSPPSYALPLPPNQSSKSQPAPSTTLSTALSSMSGNPAATPLLSFKIVFSQPDFISSDAHSSGLKMGLISDANKMLAIPVVIVTAIIFIVIIIGNNAASQ
ncbi:hypothetical protein K432DRAFT_409844 [Lepidopterella palustris CBS 459.81]|uniref:Uncharacterized protein n=1 Tax=Lepidopterella palustris CBS 459.81 TaxID=1314670 RepID=A0A8E2DZE1_9PEZI|nr:hypothetical protein K432DRAFT_409844 [Lepidopterella palustris CBS 459.81]